jgi:hypothetical protein
VPQSNGIGVTEQGSAMEKEFRYLSLYGEVVRRRDSLTKKIVFMETFYSKAFFIMWNMECIIRDDAY